MMGQVAALATLAGATIWVAAGMVRVLASDAIPAAYRAFAAVVGAP